MCVLQDKFSADQTVVELGGLLPTTDYSVTLYALYDEDPSDPVTAVATTCKKPRIPISLFPFPGLFSCFLVSPFFISFQYTLHHFLFPSHSLFLPLFFILFLQILLNQFSPYSLSSTSRAQQLFTDTNKMLHFSALSNHLSKNLLPPLFILLSLLAVPLPSPVSVHFPMVTHSTLRVSWVPGAVDVPGHRITYSTNHGSDVKQVIWQNLQLPNIKSSVFQTKSNTILLYSTFK